MRYALISNQGSRQTLYRGYVECKLPSLLDTVLFSLLLVRPSRRLVVSALPIPTIDYFCFGSIVAAW